MKYSLLEIKLEDGKFVYTEDRRDKQDRQRDKCKILGMTNLAFVYCPRGKENEWRKRLYKYVEERLVKQIEDAAKTLVALKGPSFVKHYGPSIVKSVSRARKPSQTR